MVLGNTLWLTALGYYIYITFLGYSCLPQLRSTRIFLYPLTLLAILYIVTLLIGWNVSTTLINFYRYRVLWSNIFSFSSQSSCIPVKINSFWINDTHFLFVETFDSRVIKVMVVMEKKTNFVVVSLVIRVGARSMKKRWTSRKKSKPKFTSLIALKTILYVRCSS